MTDRRRRKEGTGIRCSHDGAQGPNRIRNVAAERRRSGTRLAARRCSWRPLSSFPHTGICAPTAGGYGLRTEACANLVHAIMPSPSSPGDMAAVPGTSSAKLAHGPTRVGYLRVSRASLAESRHFDQALDAFSVGDGGGARSQRFRWGSRANPDRKVRCSPDAARAQEVYTGGEMNKCYTLVTLTTLVR